MVASKKIRKIEKIRKIRAKKIKKSGKTAQGLGPYQPSPIPMSQQLYQQQIPQQQVQQFPSAQQFQPQPFQQNSQQSPQYFQNLLINSPTGIAELADEIAGIKSREKILKKVRNRLKKLEITIKQKRNAAS